jgi:hypothetical protein
MEENIMICKYCGNVLPDNAAFCSYCGGAQDMPQQNTYPYSYQQGQQQAPQYYGNPNMPQQNAYSNSYQQGQQQAQQYYGNPNTQQQTAQSQYYANSNMPYNNTYNHPANSQGFNMASAPYKEQEQGMKWFKFIIWVQLFATALVDLYNGYQYLTGALYNSSDHKMSDVVYNLYSGLKQCDMLFGVIFIIMAVYAIIVRFMLAGFKKNGPTLYFILIAMAIVIQMAYTTIVSMITKVNLFVSQTSSPIVVIMVDIILLIVNIIYFGKRKHKFVN